MLCAPCLRVCLAVLLAAFPAIFLVSGLLPGCDGDPAWLVDVETETPPWAIRGHIVHTDGTREGWIVFHRGVIVSVGAAEEEIPSQARRLRYDGYVFPGLIDTHNHPQYNAVPRWEAPRRYGNRYEWGDDPDYRQKVRSVYDTLRDEGVSYAAMKYGEVRALIGGTTAMQGSYAPAECNLLVRNLGPASYRAAAWSFDIDRIPTETVAQVIEGLRSGTLRRWFLHIAEGTDPDSLAEFDRLEERGLLRSGVVLIHGIAFLPPHFRAMASADVPLVWSPASNLTLYGQTADVVSALKEGVTVALAPDWAVTGSDNLLEEMKVAWEYSKKSLGGKITARDLFEMATVNAAKVAGVDGFLGRLEPRHGADLFLAPKLDDDPFVSLLKTCPRHIELVFVDGRPLYGDEARVLALVPEGAADRIEVDGAEKAIVMVGDLAKAPRADEHFSDVCEVLEAHMTTLAPLIEE